MEQDAFSKYHPAVNFIFFMGSILFAVLIQHPVYLLTGAICAGLYYLLLCGRKAAKTILLLIPFFVLLTAVNPLFNTRGTHILFRIFGRPYTLEALYYGAATAGIFVVMMLWFGCYNAVMTGDKFTALFGNLIPSLSLLLVMILRLVPDMLRKTKQISGSRRSIGKSSAPNSTFREKLHDGMTVLSTLVSLALEGSLVTADSMCSRGYGCTKRSSFMLYRMKISDWVLLFLQLCLIGIVSFFLLFGAASAEFTPVLQIAPVSGQGQLPLSLYCIYLLIPTIAHSKEVLLWHYSRSRI